MLDYRKIRSERQWRASTGLTESQFHKLTELFAETYEKHHKVSLSVKSERLYADFILKTYADCLFFVLFQLKNALCFDNLGLLIETDSSNAQRNFKRYLAILELVLENQDAMPSRNFKSLEEFKQKIQSESEIIIDCSEHSTQRPKDYETQKDYYSGKKKTHLQRVDNQ